MDVSMPALRTAACTVLLLAGVAVLPAQPGSAARAEAEAPLATPADQPQAIRPHGSDIRVQDPLLVVNRDGSAAVGATLTNRGDAEASLMTVRVVVRGQALPVASTFMWLPVPTEYPAQVGAASDAGGFVVPKGVDADAGTATVQFHFADDTCLETTVDIVRRTRRHDLIYPVDGAPLGAARPPAAACTPSAGAADDGTAREDVSSPGRFVDNTSGFTAGV